MTDPDRPSELLPWEDTQGVGVCLSGGGLRAASFALGAVQALQEHRGLLYGPRAADHLAVVSGGSYLGATLMLNAAQAPPDDPPLADGTGEATFVVGHGEYLKRWSTASRMGAGALVNLIAFAALFVIAGVALSVAGALLPQLTTVGAGQVAAAVAFLLAGRVVLRVAYVAGRRNHLVPLALALLVMVVTAGTTLLAMRQAAPLSQTAWWTDQPWRIALVAVVAVLAGVSAAFLAKRWPDLPPTRAVVFGAARVPAIVGAIGFCLVATGLDGLMDRGFDANATDHDFWTAFFVTGGAVVLAVVAQRVATVSLHGMYRDGLSRCFAIRRGTQTTLPPTEACLSALGDGRGDPERRFPRLLVCATANVVWRPQDPMRAPSLLALRHKGTRPFALFVLSHDRCGMPGVPGASYATEDLERITERAGILGRREPLMSLMSAVASTGAAVSPAMGRRTSAVARPLIALFNLRLGRWVPNPLSPWIRADLAGPDPDRAMRRRRVLGIGYDEFLPELFGLHQADAARVYLSDGGHYDNLGLIALLRARCREIWVVDAQSDAHGHASQLRTVMRIAEAELRVSFEDLDLDAFQASEPGILGTGHVRGTVRYPDDGGEATITIIKLGLTHAMGDLADEQAYALTDRGFAHHGTFWPPLKVMWYDRERFDHYRRVGYANASAACAERAPQTSSV